MKTVGIIGAMDLEVNILIENMNSLQKETIAGFTYYLGKIKEQDVVITICGIGKVNAASCTQILINRFKVDYIINTGIAGGMNSKVKVCDLVISKDVTYHDVRKAQMKNCFPFQEYFIGDEQLIRLAKEACDSIQNKEWNYHLGRVVTGECFIQDKSLKESIIKEYSPYCVEMEGSAIGHVAHINKIPFVVIRSISDNSDEEATMNYKQFEEISASQSAMVVLNMIGLLE